ncbi:hypothetical protein N1851_007172 [Merluccius polli]|uniref:Uncharacterized protein n=1 Tax=Merluccius polli TaxID=89951 RepID=A0AA47N353_MERPO|nr:hypothetical protein N1851_007172 [Merluccius polli]
MPCDPVTPNQYPIVKVNPKNKTHHFSWYFIASSISGIPKVWCAHPQGCVSYDQGVRERKNKRSYFPPRRCAATGSGSAWKGSGASRGRGRSISLRLPLPPHGGRGRGPLAPGVTVDRDGLSSVRPNRVASFRAGIRLTYNWRKGSAAMSATHPTRLETRTKEYTHARVRGSYETPRRNESEGRRAPAELYVLDLQNTLVECSVDLHFQPACFTLQPEAPPLTSSPCFIPNHLLLLGSEIPADSAGITLSPVSVLLNVNVSDRLL